MSPGPAPDPEFMRSLVRRQIEDLWGRSDISLIPELYAEDVVDHNPVPGQRPGHDGLRDVIDVFSTGFPDLSMTLHGVMVDGDRAVDHWTLRATHLGPFLGMPPTGLPVEFTGIDVIRVGADGKVAEIWHVEDMARMLTQLGVPTGLRVTPASAPGALR